MEGASNKGHAGDEQGDVANEGAGVRDLGSSRGALFRNRLLDLLLADGLQLLVLRGGKERKRFSHGCNLLGYARFRQLEPKSYEEASGLAGGGSHVSQLNQSITF